MTITREQVADLREGDIVRYSGHRALHGALIEGPLYNEYGALIVGGYTVRKEDGGVYSGDPITLTVVSRVPRPLYINHDRIEPVPGDVVRDADDETRTRWWWFTNSARDMPWRYWDDEIVYCRRHALPVRLRLLVDGATGQVVP